MSSPSRPKSPHGVAPKKDDKEESFWDKIGTLGRKKKIKEGLCFIFSTYI
jgi:parvin